MDEDTASAAAHSDAQGLTPATTETETELPADRIVRVLNEARMAPAVQRLQRVAELHELLLHHATHVPLLSQFAPAVLDLAIDAHADVRRAVLAFAVIAAAREPRAVLLPCAPILAMLVGDTAPTVARRAATVAMQLLPQYHAALSDPAWDAESRTKLRDSFIFAIAGALQRLMPVPDTETLGMASVRFLQVTMGFFADSSASSSLDPNDLNSLTRVAQSLISGIFNSLRFRPLYVPFAMAAVNLLTSIAKIWPSSFLEVLDPCKQLATAVVDPKSAENLSMTISQIKSIRHSFKINIGVIQKMPAMQPHRRDIYELVEILSEKSLMNDIVSNKRGMSMIDSDSLGESTKRQKMDNAALVTEKSEDLKSETMQSDSTSATGAAGSQSLPAEITLFYQMQIALERFDLSRLNPAHVIQMVMTVLINTPVEALDAGVTRFDRYKTGLASAIASSNTAAAAARDPRRRDPRRAVAPPPVPIETILAAQPMDPQVISMLQSLHEMDDTLKKNEALQPFEESKPESKIPLTGDIKAQLPQEIKPDASSSNVSAEPISNTSGALAPSSIALPSIGTAILSPEDCRSQLYNAFQRLLKCEAEVAACGQIKIWRMLHARLVSRTLAVSDGIDEQADATMQLKLKIGDELVDFICKDFKLRHELALAWLYEEFLARTTIEVDGKTLPAYDHWLDKILNKIMTFLDPRDKTFAKFLLEAPKFTSACLNALQTYCDDSKRLALGFATLRDLLISRPPTRKQCLNLMLKYCIHKDKTIRPAAIVMAKKWAGLHVTSSKRQENPAATIPDGEQSQATSIISAGMTDSSAAAISEENVTVDGSASSSSSEMEADTSKSSEENVPVSDFSGSAQKDMEVGNHDVTGESDITAVDSKSLTHYLSSEQMSELIDQFALSMLWRLARNHAPTEEEDLFSDSTATVVTPPDSAASTSATGVVASDSMDIEKTERQNEMTETEAASTSSSTDTKLIWTEDDASRCLELFFALCARRPEMIKCVAEVYAACKDSVVQNTLRLRIAGLIKAIGICDQIIDLIRDFPEGSQPLILRIVVVLAENEKPPAILVDTVKSVYESRSLDVRFLVPILNNLSKKEILAQLPRLMGIYSKADRDVRTVRNIINTLINNSDGAAPLTPTELLVALHNMEEKIGLVKTIEAIKICFSMSAIFKQEILAIVLQQLVDQQQIPILFMRTVIQTVTAYKGLASFANTILTKLVAKKVWTNPKLWEGFIRCIKVLMSTSLPVLMLLPRKQLEEVLRQTPEIREPLREFTKSSLAQQQGVKAIQNVLAALGGLEQNVEAGEV